MSTQTPPAEAVRHPGSVSSPRTRRAARHAPLVLAGALLVVLAVLLWLSLVRPGPGSGIPWQVGVLAGLGAALAVGLAGVVLSLGRELTRRERTERDLRLNEERHRKLFEESTTGMGLADPDTGTILACNRALADLVGRQVSELVGASQKILHAPAEQAGEFSTTFRDHLGPRQGEVLPSQFVTKGGEIRDVEIKAGIVEVGGQRLVLGIFHDVTELNRALRASEESETRLRAIFENSVDAIGVSRDGCHVLVNPAYLRMFGYADAEELAGRPILDVIASDARPAMEERIARRAELGVGTCRFETRGLRRDGSPFEMEVNRASYELHGDEYSVVILRDVTERRRLEDQLRQSQKMEAVGTLAGGIAHDFNNILGAIYGYAELTRLDLPEGTNAHRNLGHVLAAAERAKELVKQILTFSRKADEHKGVVELHEVVQEAMKLLEASIPKTIEVRRDLDAGAGRILANPTQIHQVLMNLCTNAYQAMRETGGVLEVAVKPVQVDARLASRVPDLGEGPHLLLAVRDTGPGMDEATVSRIFEPYFTTKGVGEGTGMGLAVVHGIVRSHHGAVAVESAVGRGTTFRLYFPRYLGAEFADAEEVESVPRGRSEHVLLVDDEPDLVDVGREILESLGYRVTAVAASGEAWERFQATPEAFDVVVTDQTMPGLTGADLARGILEIRRDLPVIICTGYSDVLDADKAHDLGVKALLMKPFNRGALARALRDALP